MPYMLKLYIFFTYTQSKIYFHTHSIKNISSYTLHQKYIFTHTPSKIYLHTHSIKNIFSHTLHQKYIFKQTPSKLLHVSIYLRPSSGSFYTTIYKTQINKLINLIYYLLLFYICLIYAKLTEDDLRKV